MEGDVLKELVRTLIRETLEELQITSGKMPPLTGVVSAVNPDGTFSVAAGGLLFSNVSSPRQVTLNEQVMVLSSNGITVIL